MGDAANFIQVKDYNTKLIMRPKSEFHLGRHQIKITIEDDHKI